MEYWLHSRLVHLVSVKPSPSLSSRRTPRSFSPIGDGLSSPSHAPNFARALISGLVFHRHNHVFFRYHHPSATVPMYFFILGELIEQRVALFQRRLSWHLFFIHWGPIHFSCYRISHGISSALAMKVFVRRSVHIIFVRRWNKTWVNRSSLIHVRLVNPLLLG